MSPLLATFLLRFAAASPLAPSPLTDDHYSETYTAIIDLDDGTYAQLQLGISNLGPGDSRGMCRALLVTPDRTAWTANLRGDSGTWSYTATPEPTFATPSCRITERASSVDIDAELEGTRLHLHLATPLRAVRPPDGALNVPGERGGIYESDILVPWAEATLDVTRAGQADSTRSGVGYIDHSRTTTLPDGIARGWLRFRALRGECAQLLLLRWPPVDGAAHGWHWRRGMVAPIALHLSNARLPSAPPEQGGAAINLGSEQESFVMTPRFMLYRHAPVEELGFVGRLIKAWFGNPTTRTYRAVYRGPSDPCGDVPGILEITHVKE